MLDAAVGRDYHHRPLEQRQFVAAAEAAVALSEHVDLRIERSGEDGEPALVLG